MLIRYERPGMFWHADCEKNPWKSGVMRVAVKDVGDERSLIECLHCGKKGYYPYGRVGDVCCDEETTANVEVTGLPQCADGSDAKAADCGRSG